MSTTVGILTEIVNGVLETVKTELVIMNGSIVINGDGASSVDDIAGLRAELDSLIPTDQIGVTVAQLIGGVVPSSQLPSYVDDVLEFANLAAFPVTGEAGKIYVAIDTNRSYRWSGSVYAQIIGGTVDSVSGKTGVVTLNKSDVGLPLVDNTSDDSKPISTATAIALSNKQPLATVLTNTTASFTTAKDSKLSGIESGAQVNTVSPSDLALKEDVLYSAVVYQWQNTGAAAGVWTNTSGTSHGTSSLSLPMDGANAYLSQFRRIYSNTASANQMQGIRNTDLLFFVGSAAGRGGFIMASRFGFDVWASGGRMFVGFSANTNSVTTVNPSTTNNSIGFCVDDTDGNAIYFMSRNATSSTKVATGLSLSTGAGFDIKITCPSNASSVSWSIKNINTGASASGVISSNLPISNIMMTAGVLSGNAALTSAGSIQIGVTPIIYLKA